MNRTELSLLLEFADTFGMMDKPATEVIQCWLDYIKSYYEEAEADAWNCTMEAHELRFWE